MATRLTSVKCEYSEVEVILEDEEPIMGLDSESDISDEEDSKDDPDYCPLGEQNQSDTEESSDEASEEEEETDRPIMCDRISRKGSNWAELPPSQSKRQNIVRSRPGPAPRLTTVSPIDAWRLFITDNIIEEVLTCTNMEGRRVAAGRGKQWKNVSKDELMAFFGLTILAGSERNWDVPIRDLFGSPLHNPMYKATMSIGRFEDIRRFLCFDDKRTRAARLETDNLAAFRYVWDLFLVNCRTRFIPSDCVTVAEQLVPCRGKAKFLQYMKSKPAKYGIKIFWVCDARTNYAIDGIVYTGRQPGEEDHKNQGFNIVSQLCSGFRHTGRNITMDNFFTSVPLAEHLLEKDLTIVGTLLQNSPDIPPVMQASKTRELFSSEFGFNGRMTMVSYVGRKKKAVVFLSTMHHSKTVDKSTEKKKPEIIHFYNQTKGGVDIVDQMIHTYTCKRQTRRWPMVLWYNMIDIATLNAYTFFKTQHPELYSGIGNARRHFLTELSHELVVPYMRSRLECNTCLPANITSAMETCGVTRVAVQPQKGDRQGPQKRKRCRMCPRDQDRKAGNICWKCSVPVCNAHSQKRVLCNCCSK